MATLEENVRQVNSDFNAIKTEIVNAGVEVAEGTKTEEYSIKVRQVYKKGVDDANEEIKHINNELEQTLYGIDTGGKGFYNLVYQNITITQDCTNALQLATIFNAVVGEDEEIVMFINQKWTSYPDSSTPNNTILNAMIYSSKYRETEPISRSGYFMRWREGAIGLFGSLTREYDTNVKAGDVFRKVVLRWKNI